MDSRSVKEELGDVEKRIEQLLRDLEELDEEDDDEDDDDEDMDLNRRGKG